eukprot:TRINITY_DN8475_c0_g1_i1.p1 TRINITY_DN8475_c0_g1~~TRINITY_DN8475_c0_g1_i1.p1  ORF type:complete len:190 (-),score=22.16 TRINITY_DN8475_c0_g1_i1:136-705(-)
MESFTPQTILNASILSVLFICLSNTVTSSYFDRRYIGSEGFGANPCSLIGDHDSNAVCALRSNASNLDDGQILQMHFGESNCSVVIRNCKKKVCFFIADKTLSIQTDEVERDLPTSFFSEVSFLGAEFTWTKKGIQFTPTEETVTFRYSTLSCDSFYRIRGSIYPQLCSRPIKAISNIAEKIGCYLPDG